MDSGLGDLVELRAATSLKPILVLVFSIDYILNIYACLSDNCFMRKKNSVDRKLALNCTYRNRQIYIFAYTSPHAHTGTYSKLHTHAYKRVYNIVESLIYEIPHIRNPS